MAFTQVLTTERFTLNAIRPEDIAEIFLLRSHPDVIKYLGRDAMKTMSEAEKYIERSMNERKKEEAVDFAIRKHADGKLIGKIGIWKIQKDRNRAELGYSLLPAFHRKGIMYECAQRVLDFCFQDQQFHSICAEIDPMNNGSRLLLEKCNFRKEAHFTEDYLYNGVYSDSAIYSLLEKWR